MVEVVCVGDANVDIIAHFVEYPIQGHDALAEAVEFHCGGSAANAAIAMARLGLAVGLVSRVGADPWAALAVKALHKAGVRLGQVQRDATATTGLTYVVVTPDGERTMLSHRGANARTDPAELNDGLFRGARLLCLSGYALLAEPQKSAALRAWSLARAYGLASALDPGLAICQAAPGEILSLLPEVELLLPSLAEVRLLSGRTAPEDCARDLVDHGARTVAVKMGGQGCVVATGAGCFHVPAFNVQVRDSTGAGDAFAAGMIAAVLRGLDWQSAAVLANAMGALAAARLGAETPEDVDKHLLALLRESAQGLVWEACPAGSGGAMRFLETRHQQADTKERT